MDSLDEDNYRQATCMMQELRDRLNLYDKEFDKSNTILNEGADL